MSDGLIERIATLGFSRAMLLITERYRDIRAAASEEEAHYSTLRLLNEYNDRWRRPYALSLEADSNGNLCFHYDISRARFSYYVIGGIMVLSKSWGSAYEEQAAIVARELAR